MNRSLTLLFFLIFPGLLLAKDNSLGIIYTDRTNPSVTQSNFKDYPTDSLLANHNYQNIYFQFNVSALFANLSDWKNSLHLADGTHPSSNCMVFGGDCGYIINKYLQVGIGYEFFFTTKATTIEVNDDQISGAFFYGSLTGGTFLKSLPELYLFSKIDVGSISATETMEDYIVQNFERTGKATAYRFTIGAQYYTSDNWSITAGAGYMSGDIRKITAYGSTFPNFTLDFSGLILRGEINYHIPL